MSERNLFKAMVAEAIGTFALTFIAVLSIVAVSRVRGPVGLANLASIGLAQGLTIMVMVASLGAVSGGHFNPAITLGFVVTRRIRFLAGAAYWLAQLVGASLAAFLLVPIIGAGFVGLGAPALGVGISFWSGVVLEAVGTFFLVLAVFGTAVDGRAPKSIYPIAIGLTIAFDIMAFGPLTGGAVNPARAIGPALASGQWANQLVYWIGPLIGGAAAALLDNYFFMEPARPVPLTVGGPTPEEERRAA